MSYFISANTISSVATTPIRTASVNYEHCKCRIANNSANKVTIDITYDGIVVFPNVVLYPKGSNTNMCNFDIDLAPTKVLAVVTTTTDTLTYYITGGDI